MIVSDSTTLIILYDLGKLEYLHNLFQTIYIPQKVYEEISFKKEIILSDFILISKPKPTSRLEELKLLLDDGESEAIALALEKNLPLIIDEKKGRKIAKNLNIAILGLLGIIYLNIKKGFISIDEATCFLANAKNNGYRISQKLIDEMFERVYK